MIAGDLEPVGDAHAGDTRGLIRRDLTGLVLLDGESDAEIRQPFAERFRITVLLSSPSNSDTSSRAASSSSGIRALIDDIVYVVNTPCYKRVSTTVSPRRTAIHAKTLASGRRKTLFGG